MEYCIRGNEGTFQLPKNGSDLASFIVAHPTYIYPLINIVNVLSEVNYDQRSDFTASSLRECELMGQVIVDTPESTHFVQVLESFLQRDIATSGQLRGKLLEYLINAIGPMSDLGDDRQTVRDCYLVDSEERLMGGGSNFDFAFIDYENRKYELLECKFTLANFLDYRKAQAMRKIEYMDTISNILIGKNYNVHVAFVSLAFSIAYELYFLDNHGLTQIAIYNYEDMMTRFEVRRSSQKNQSV